ncbi:DUF6161 domain-containing protein [Aeromonas dhakensis]|uniref:DUF6161 domain-containing protein n=1 Tax=Aeromonas dhakensis TaxID=196024 RepID=UPI0012DFFCCC|nr:DUF6161 domain-containing protein [Aeromonas dhakensis]
MSEQVVDSIVVIPLGEGRSDKIFSSIEQYNEFLKNERVFWKWLDTRASSPQVDILKLAKYQCIDTLLKLVSESDINSQIELLGKRSKDWLPIYSFTPEGQFIQHVLEKYGMTIAAFSLFHICDCSFNALSESYRSNPLYQHMLAALSSQNALAINLVFAFQRDAYQTMPTYENSIKDMHQQFTLTLSSAEERVVKSINAFNDKFDTIIVQHENLYQGTKRRYKRFASRLLRTMRSFGRLTKDVLDKSNVDIEQARSAYHEQVDLEASVNYWMAKKTRNNRNAFIWFIFGIGGSVGATFYLLAKYYSKGGIIGISANLADTGGSGAEAANQLQSVAATATSGMEHLVFNTTGAALVVTLMAVIIRVALRQFNTYSHLSLEAEERVTMVKTYLALLNEGKLKSDQDRHLALEALFRTSQTGMIAETSFNSPVDIIVKSLADKAKV